MCWRDRQYEIIVQTIAEEIKSAKTPESEYLKRLRKGANVELDFYRHRRAIEHGIPELPLHRPNLLVTDDIAKRAAASVRWSTVKALHTRLEWLRTMPESAWDSERKLVQAVMLEIKRTLRMADSRLPDFLQIELQRAFNCRFTFPGDDIQNALRQRLLSELSKTLDDWMKVLSGDTTILEVTPCNSDVLPLVSIWGSMAVDSFSAWRKRSQSKDKKTHEMVERLCNLIGASMGGICLEYMQPSHVLELVSILRDRKNSDSTVANRMGLVATILADFPISDETRRALRSSRPNTKSIRKTKNHRDPFDESQLRVVLPAIFRDRSLPPDDRVIIALHALTGARLEELCAAHAAQLQWHGRYWTIDIVDHRAAFRRKSEGSIGLGEAPLKTAESKRKIPFLVDCVPGLHERLLVLTKTSGRLFPHLTPNKYGDVSTAASKRLNLRIRRIVGGDRRLVLESLRNTAAPAMRRAGVDPDERRAFLGHAPLDIHQDHYDKILASELLGAARAVHAMVAKAIEGEQIPRLDVTYMESRAAMRNPAPDMRDEVGQGAPEKLPAVNPDESDSDLVAHPDLVDPPPPVDTAACALVAKAHAPDLDPQVELRQVKIGTRGMDSTTFDMEWVRRLGFEHNGIDLKQTCDHQFRETLDTAARSIEPAGFAPPASIPDANEEAQPARRSRDTSLRTTPALEEIEATCPGDKILDARFVALGDVVHVEQLSHGGKSPFTAQEGAPGVVGQLHVRDGMNLIAAEFLREILIGPSAHRSIWRLRVPTKSVGNGALDAEGQRVVVGGARALGPLRERLNAGFPNVVAPLVNCPIPVGFRTSTLHGLFLHHDNGHRNRKRDRRNGLDEHRDGDPAIAPTNVAGFSAMPGERVVHLFGDARLPAKLLKKVPETMEDQERIRDTAPLILAQVSAEPTPPIGAPRSEPVRDKAWKEPFAAGGLLAPYVAGEPRPDQFGMYWHETSRTGCFDPLSRIVIADVDDWTVCAVQLDIGGPQLSEFIQARPGAIREKRNPCRSFAATGAWPEPLRIDWRGKDSVQVLCGERSTPQALDLAPGSTQAASDVCGKLTRIGRGLHQRADEADPLRYGCRGQALAKQKVTVGGDITACDFSYGQRDSVVEILGGGFELYDRPRWAIGRERAPVLAKRGERAGGPWGYPMAWRLRCLARDGSEVPSSEPECFERRRDGRRYGNRAEVAQPHRDERLVPLSRQLQRSQLCGASVGGVEVRADDLAQARVQRSRDADLEPEFSLVECDVAHFGHPFDEWLGRRQASAPPQKYAAMYAISEKALWIRELFLILQRLIV